MSQNNKYLVRYFKQQGYSLRVDGLQILQEKIQTFRKQNIDINETLEKLVDIIREKQSTEQNFILTKEIIEEGLNVIQNTKNVDIEAEAFFNLNAFKFPQLHFNSSLNSYEKRAENGTTKLFGNAENRTSGIRSRVELILRKLSRNPLFEISSSSSSFLPHKANDPSASSSKIQITSVESLMGSKGPRWTLGVLSYIETDQLFLEDLSGKTKVDLRRLKSQEKGVYSEGNVVLVYGQMADGVFIAERITHPPTEPRSKTLSLFPKVDFTGLATEDFITQKLKKFEEENTTASLLFLSDVWLDKEEVFDKLHELFSAYQSQPPAAIVLCGDFSSKPMSSSGDDIEEIKSRYQRLAALLQKFPTITQSSKIVIIGGANDQSGNGVVPSPPLPSFFIRPLLRIPNVIVGSNPTRLRFATQTFLIFRENLFNHVKNCAILPPNLSSSVNDNNNDMEIDNDDPQTQFTHHFATTIMDQGCLSPLPYNSKPIYWNFEHSLQMEINPDVLVLADRVQQYDVTYEGTVVFNPSSFGVDYSFASYCLSTKEVVFSMIGSEGIEEDPTATAEPFDLSVLPSADPLPDADDENENENENADDDVNEDQDMNDDNITSLNDNDNVDH